MRKPSAGLLVYRWRNGGLEVFLVHPGGPFWAKKDLGAWSIPKGEYAEDEQPLEAAKREFREETGFPVEGRLIELGSVKQSGGKFVSVWAVQGDCDPDQLISNHCQIQWPPHSGRYIQVPEVDRADWFLLEEARRRILKSQAPLLDMLAQKLASIETNSRPDERSPEG